MSAGLVASDGATIFIASDSKGLVPPDEPVPDLSSKIFELQASPKVWVVISGYLYHWRLARDEYQRQAPQGDVRSAAEEIGKLLNSNTPQDGEVFGIVCGFLEGKAACFRVGRLKGSLVPNPVSGNEIVDPTVVLDLAQGYRVKEMAQAAIRGGKNREAAIREAIESIATDSADDIVRKPVITHILRDT